MRDKKIDYELAYHNLLMELFIWKDAFNDALEKDGTNPCDLSLLVQFITKIENYAKEDTGDYIGSWKVT